MKKWARMSLVIFGAIIVTALGIDAADTLDGASGTMLSQIIGSDNACGPGMTPVDMVPGVRCVDIYEASTGKNCPSALPVSMIESHKNTETKECAPESKAGAMPWSFVTRDQAMQLCARSGKRLPTSAEWYALTLGMADVEGACNVGSRKLSPSGEFTACTAPHGAYDLVGNLWEWVSDDVVDGMYNERSLPQNGYVREVDATGIALQTSDTDDELYGRDYFWAPGEGSFGIVRGGYYDSGSDGGVYAAHTDTKSNSASVGIGFRCVQ
jgi:Sulfatase-modifying factor enzyme 1